MAPSGLEPEDDLSTPRTLVGTEVRLPRLVRLKVFAVLLLGTISILIAILLYRRLEDLLSRNRSRFSVSTHICRIKTLYVSAPGAKCGMAMSQWCGLWEWPRRWLSWKGSNDDYHWIWWDPPNRDVGHLDCRGYCESSPWHVGDPENARTKTSVELQTRSEAATVSETLDISARKGAYAPHSDIDLNMRACNAPSALTDMQIANSGNRLCLHRGMPGIYSRTWPQQVAEKRAALRRL
ncbi:hypothetical protein VTN49DRAFT_764 [Thermomyces lanuginosus]|uniref:uncharacterized protein n=1 Tax=Thermomyces lanuginosus TaxID=5541 RepID=UPI003744323B